MRITYFRLGRGRARIADLRRRLQLARRLSTVRHKLRILRELRDAEQDVALREARNVRIIMSSFNLNGVEEEQCLIDFRSRRNEIGGIAQLIGRDGADGKEWVQMLRNRCYMHLTTPTGKVRTAIMTFNRC